MTMLPKPFEPRELSLRIANILKRSAAAGAAASRVRCGSGLSCIIWRAANYARARTSFA